MDKNEAEIQSYKSHVVRVSSVWYKFWLRNKMKHITFWASLMKIDVSTQSFGGQNCLYTTRSFC
jgi:hypothetical protein